jgi:hypothetical protein
MHCLRCDGLLIAVQMTDIGQPPIPGWSCLLCGATTDPGIEANRANHAPPNRNRVRVPGTPAVKMGKGGVR